MKKIVTVTDLCCERCARRLADKLALSENVMSAKADYKKNRIYVEVSSTLTDEKLQEMIATEGYQVLSVELRKGLFS